MIVMFLIIVHVLICIWYFIHLHTVSILCKLFYLHSYIVIFCYSVLHRGNTTHKCSVWPVCVCECVCVFMLMYSNICRVDNKVTKMTAINNCAGNTSKKRLMIIAEQWDCVSAIFCLIRIFYPIRPIASYLNMNF